MGLTQIPSHPFETIESIETFMNSLFEAEPLLKSRFLVFFLSCTNNKKFNKRKAREFTKEKSIFSIFGGGAKPVRRLNRDGFQTNISLSRQEGASRIIADVNMDNQELVTQLKQNLFIEDLNRFCDYQSSLVQRASTIYSEFEGLLTRLNEKMAEMGNIFYDLSKTYSKIESDSLEDISKVVPSTSQLFGSLKLIFFNLSNSLSTQSSNLDKYLQPSFNFLKEVNKEIREMLDQRSELIIKKVIEVEASDEKLLAHRTARKQESLKVLIGPKKKDSSQISEKKKLLLKCNEEISGQFVQKYKDEQEYLMMQTINLAAFQSSYLQKVKLSVHI